MLRSKFYCTTKIFLKRLKLKSQKIYLYVKENPVRLKALSLEKYR